MRTIVLLGAAALVTACHAAGNAEGTGPIVQRDFPVAGAFDKIALSGSPDVVVTVGAAASVRAEGEADMLDRLEITNENGQLQIGLRNTRQLVRLGPPSRHHHPRHLAGARRRRRSPARATCASIASRARPSPARSPARAT